MRRVLMLVQRRIKVLDAQQDINTQVEEEIGDRQREMYLREQLKAIRKELGDDDGSENLEELKERVAGLELPPAARKEVDRELKRLERMGRESMESQVIRTYIETVCELPWSEISERKAGPLGRGAHPGRGPLRPRGYEGPDPGVPRGAGHARSPGAQTGARRGSSRR